MINSKSPLIRMSVTGGNIADTLRILTQNNIFLYDVIQYDELTAGISVSPRDITVIKNILNKRGDRYEQHNTSIYAKMLRVLQRRYILLLSLLVFIGVTIWIPTRIFFIEVTGNVHIPDNRILEIVSGYGLHFGAVREEIRSEAVKNQLLAEVDSICWVGVTTNGCVDTVQVQEKPIAEEQKSVHIVSSIVATCDGVVEEITATQGKAICKPGQAVRVGQVLISGYEDHGFLIKAGRAEGEIIAQTIHSVAALTPVTVVKRAEKLHTETNISVKIGKNIIKFNNNSGISPTTCVKLYEEKSVALPGGYLLPVTLMIETVIYYKTDLNDLTEDDVLWMENLTQAYIEENMLGGIVLRKSREYRMTEQSCLLKAIYTCREQIGKNRIEETLDFYGKDS